MERNLDFRSNFSYYFMVDFCAFRCQSVVLFLKNGQNRNTIKGSSTKIL